MSAKRRLGLFLGFSLWLFPVGTACALSLTLAAPGVGPVTEGVATLVAAGAPAITFAIGLDENTAIKGYDLSVAWDAEELALVEATQLAPGPGGSAPPFLVAPDPSGDAGTRAFVLLDVFDTFATSSLFALRFAVNSSHLVSDGQADVRFFVGPANGDPLAPATLVPANPGGAGIDVVPEPGTLGLVMTGLAALATCRSHAIQPAA